MGTCDTDEPNIMYFKILASFNDKLNGQWNVAKILPIYFTCRKFRHMRKPLEDVVMLMYLSQY